MKITKQERAVIKEIEKVMMLHNQFITINPVLTADLARWHLAKLKEARADTYLDTVLMASRGPKWKLNMAAPIGKPCDAPKKGHK